MPNTSAFIIAEDLHARITRIRCYYRPPAILRQPDAAPLPEDIRSECMQLQEALAHHLTAMDENKAKRLLQRTLHHFATPDNVKQRLGDYYALLRHYPEDLLIEACREVLRTHRYHCLPKIAQFIDAIDSSHRQRLYDQQKLAELLSSGE